MRHFRVIFVHGMGPKPPREQHWQQWRQALRYSLWTELPEEATAMAYWADLRRRRPLRFRMRAGLFNLFRARLMKVFAHDVYLFFYTDIGDAVRQRLREALAAAAGQRVAVVAHSLGTVIAYDVLRRGDARVELLITMGSPLGLAPIRRELAAPGGFPANVHRWLNVFDGLDPVTLPDQRLADDYTLNGARLVIDRMIRENYSPEGKRDPHGLFGYLTCPEVGDALSQFWIAP